jgi:hypothetical protein
MGMPDVLVMPLRVRNVPPGRLVAYFGAKIDTLKQIAKQKGTNQAESSPYKLKITPTITFNQRV